jgi:hypothetical protein
MQMLKKFACAVALFFVASIALADTVTGLITKASDTEITVVTGKKDDRKTLKFAITTDTKVFKLKGKKDSEDSTLSALQEAIKNSKGGKGVIGNVEEEKKTATKISYRAKKKSAE